MKIINKYIIPTVCMVTLIFSACRDDQWNEHNKISNDGLEGNLLEAIKTHPDGSKFYEAAIKTGCDEYLAMAASLTVFVPKNEAWQNVDFNDIPALREIVKYHIGYGKFLRTMPEIETTTLKMFNNKTVKFDGQTFNGAEIVKADNISGNGVFHVTNQLMTLNKNIWEIIGEMTHLKQAQFLYDLNFEEMDPEKSIQTGVDPIGRPEYDTIPMIVNNFLKMAPLNDEDQVFTYIVLEDKGFDHLYHKYRKYFTCSAAEATDSLTMFNVCQDFVFSGIRDIRQEGDTITNIFGVKVPVKDINIISEREASNGRIYVIDKSNILLKEKFKPVIIEGENYNRSADNNFIFIRYRPLWASGNYDMALSCNTNQTDTFLWYPPMPNKQGGDSVFTRTRRFHAIGDDGSNNKIIANMTNFFIEYKAQVNSVDYEIRYVAYNDIDSRNRTMANQYHINVPIDNPPFPEAASEVQTLRLEQKLFISMPGRSPLYKDGDRIMNNFENGVCFVSVDTAGIYKERNMMKWRYDNSLDRNMQYIQQPINDPDAHILKVGLTGELTLWLCNTTRTNVTAGSTLGGAQGMLFLDYIKLVPIVEEPLEN